MSKFVLGKKSLEELEGVHSDLVVVVHRAIELTVQDFSVHDGIRTFEEQKKLVESGASQTLDSRHITGHAVDLVPYINGKLRWEWNPIYRIADAVRMAAKELNIPLRWGGAWDVSFTDTDDLTEFINQEEII
jgi:peptidoglycan L-alanyl-D-glutamate endopeptidase CwlK